MVASDTTMAGDTLIVSDTVVIGGDTVVRYDTILAVQDGGMLGRLTGVTPNPAAERAKVVSSMGVSRVEVFSAEGMRVKDIRIPGGTLSTTLDVSRWPAGVYLLRIHTPLGMAVKRLTVVR